MKKSLKLKICGLKYPDNIREAALLKPDYMGFIFYEPSPRYAEDDFALPENFPAEIEKVGVFVNQPEAYILQKARHYGLTHIQLHGTEPPSLCESLKRVKLKIIKVFSIGTSFNFHLLQPYTTVVDYFLFDTKGLRPGGNGVAFDWNILTEYDCHVPFFLSGGLNADNISDLTKVTIKGLYGLDFNSGVEIRPGVKDIAKLNDVLTHFITTNN